MSQPKINSFFNSNLGRGGGYCNQNGDSNMATNSSRKALYWNTYKTSNQTLQMYQSKRKEQRAKKMNDQMMFNMSSELSTPPSDSQIMDDSQNFPSTSSQSQESCGWNSRPASLKPMRNPNLGRSRSGFYGIDTTDTKPDFRLYMEEVERVTKEKEEREMLQNFLLSAKQCCEEANQMATELKEQQANQTETLLSKFRKLADDIPIQKLVDNNNAQIERLDKKLQSCLDRLESLQATFDEQKEILAKSEASVVLAVQACWQNDLEDLKNCMSLKRPFCTEISTQYSPKVSTISKASQTCPNNYQSFSDDEHAVPCAKMDYDVDNTDEEFLTYKSLGKTHFQQQHRRKCDQKPIAEKKVKGKQHWRKPKKTKRTLSPAMVNEVLPRFVDRGGDYHGSSGNSATRVKKADMQERQTLELSPISSPGLVMVTSKNFGRNRKKADDYFFNWFQSDETEISLF